MSRAKTIRVTIAQSEIRAVVAASLAGALIDGISLCQNENMALTELQQANMATMSIMAYDNALKSCENLETIMEMELDSRNRS